MAASPIEIEQSTVAHVDGVAVGLIWTALDGSAARLMLANEGQDIAWESVMEVRPHQVVPLPGTPMTVSAIAGPTDAARGRLTMKPALAGNAALPEGGVVLSAGGRLRLDGPSVTTATDLSVVSWHPSEAAPNSVRVEWLSPAFPREVIPAAQIRQTDVQAGSTLQVGHETVTVLAVQGDAADHSARLVLRLSRSAP